MQPASESKKKRVLDIEDVLRWAYRDELPKRREEGFGGEPCSVSPMFRGAALGARIDNWSREPGFPLAMGEPHPDALIIEQHVLALDRYRSHVHEGDPGLAPDIGLDVDEIAAMARAWPTICLLVTVNARLSRRPPWDLAPSPAPTLAANNKPVVLVEAVVTDAKFGGGKTSRTEFVPTGQTGKSYKSGAFSPLKWSPAPQSIVIERAEYAVWWAAIDLLAHELQGKLSSISVLAPSAPQRPWAGERDLGKPIRIFEDLRARVHLREQREWAAAHRLLAHRRRRSPAPQSPRSSARGAVTKAA